MDCYIIGAGDFFGFKKRPCGDDFVIAADGGYAVCQSEGIVPDLILGDFDSLGWVPVEGNVLRVPVEKDDTDMMLAVKEGLKHGCNCFHIYGGTGGRLDHTIANLQTLLYIKTHGANGFLYDNKCCFTVLRNEKRTFTARDSGVFSVFALQGEAKGVTVSGGQYETSNLTLKEYVPVGVSNCFMGKPVTIEVLDGILLCSVPVD